MIDDDIGDDIDNDINDAESVPHFDEHDDISVDDEIDISQVDPKVIIRKIRAMQSRMGDNLNALDDEQYRSENAHDILKINDCLVDFYKILKEAHKKLSDFHDDNIL